MKNFFVDLNHLDLLAVRGEDSGKFLQGQLSCDIDSISEQQSCLGASCDNKGRVLSSFRLLKIDDVYYLHMQRGVGSSTKENLDKFIVFYQAKVEVAQNDFFRLGFVGPETPAILTKLFPEMPSVPNQLVNHQGNHLLLVSSKTLRFELWIAAGNTEKALAALGTELSEAEISDWELLDIEDGIYDVGPDDIGLYTPQLLNYDISGAVSFTKGCYTGQEIVARMHYLGSAKKRLYHIRIESDSELSGNQKLSVIDKTSEKTRGNVIKLLINKDNNYEALAIINCETVDSGDPLALQACENSSVRIVPLSYDYLEKSQI